MPSRLSSFSKTEIKKLWQNAQLKVKQPGILVFTAPQSGPTGRVLLVIPKAAGTAPERNLFKRRVRSIFKEEKLTERGYDCIVRAHKNGVIIPFETLKTHLLEAFKRS